MVHTWQWKRRTIADAAVRIGAASAVVVGTGAAGFAAAARLHGLGCRDVIMVTDNRLWGTSRNTGSDKQTYYKLTLSGSEPDSVQSMARSLFDGKCMDGDVALAEAALSVPCFMHLCEAGMPFPVNRYGEYIGYKTDHDPKRRATSVGPLTSRRMTEALEGEVGRAGIPVLEGLVAVEILTHEGEVNGLLCLDTLAVNLADAFVLFRTANIVLATGGPAIMYADSVYPESQHGASGIAFAAGALGKNLTEWQYGLASVRPRWNVSGTYMQSLPRFFSTDRQGEEPRDFLHDGFGKTSEMLTRVFLKGYEWPFDVRKLDGSSAIDLLVFRETVVRKRRVFLDYRVNPGGGAIDFGALGEQARHYLAKAGASFGTPIERLEHMNAPAVAFYRSHGVDLATQPLEIALCAQHNNGGVDVDAWWQSAVRGLFVVGEAAGTHGVYRPGGSALNAGQAGANRAARYIAAKRQDRRPDDDRFLETAEQALERQRRLAGAVLGKQDTCERGLRAAQEGMSRVGGPIRDLRSIEAHLTTVTDTLARFPAAARAKDVAGLQAVYRYREALVCQQVYLSAMRDYIIHGGRSRGSALYHDPAGRHCRDSLPETFRYTLDDGSLDELTQISGLTEGGCSHVWRAVRPLPAEDDFFENVWRSYRDNGNIDDPQDA